MRSLLFVVLVFGLVSCAKTSIEVEEFGDIEGFIIDSETGDGIQNVNVTTTPPTVAILTDTEGAFSIEAIPVGSYTIQARKPGFKNNSVSISVSENKMIPARIFLEPEDEEDPAEDNVLAVDVTAWYNSQSGDSSFVEVEYTVKNISEFTDVSDYEVYFEIVTGGNSFYFDASGSALEVEQKNVESFSKYIRSETASDILIDDIWFSTESGNSDQ
ncbi:MAG: carboxypeptidase-like regulatory domain-containing protein [Gracilimonas sp.]